MTFNLTPEHLTATVSEAYDAGGINALYSLRYSLHREDPETTLTVAEVVEMLEGTVEMIVEAAAEDGTDLSRLVLTADEAKARIDSFDA